MKPNFYALLRKGVLAIMAVCLTAGFAMAQRTISGTITDAETGETLIGANVLVEGTSVGTATDLDGNYELIVPEGATHLVFSYTGYVEQRVEIGASNVVNVALKSGAVLEEVVVVGYGTVKKKDLTGSVGQVGEEDFNKGVFNAPEQLLQGKLAGVQILGNSGAPGAASTIRIRGTSSVRTGNNPLIVIDGVPLDGRGANPESEDVGGIGDSPSSNPLNFINPNDIQSIDVLKDASATAIYGSRGANGVILITTKKGRSGKPRIDLNTSVGMSDVLRTPDYLSASQYRDALVSEGGSPANDGGANVDAFDEITRMALVQNHNLSISGGNDKGTYRVSVGLLDQEGVIERTALEKYTANASGSYKFFNDERLTIDFNLIGSFTGEETAPISNNAGFEGSLIGQALQWNPTRPLLLENGSFNQLSESFRNPLAYLDFYDDNTDVSTILGSLGATLNIIEGLDYKFLISANRSEGERLISISPQLNVFEVLNEGQAFVANNVLYSEQYTHTLNYQTDLTSDISLTALAGYEYQKYQFRKQEIFARGFSTDEVSLTNILQGAETERRIFAEEDPNNEIQSYFGRLNFNFLDKYLLTATYRRDGSSKFGENNRYGNFPSVAAAWILSEENFIPEAFDNLKLRVGWGLTGNQEFDAGAAQERFGWDKEGNFKQLNVANPDLQWEASEQINAGVDFAFLNYRLTGSLDVFRKNTQDLLLQFPAISPAPNVRFWDNVDGEVINQGIELALNGIVISKPDFTFELGGNVSLLENRLESYTGNPIPTGEINGQGLTGVEAQRLANDEPLFVFFIREFLGFNDAGIAQYTLDENGQEALVFAGDPNPNLLLGFNTNLRWKNLNAAINFNGAFGHQIYNNTANAVFTKANLNTGRNVTEDEVGNGESPTNPNKASTRYLEDGDYLRLTSASVGYTFDKFTNNWLSSLRVYVTGQNLFLITGYSGFDPEVNTNKEVDDVPSFGIEYTPYPTARTITLGINASF